MLLLHVVLSIVGLALLVKGADYFIKSAASIAKILGVSEFVIGLTLVALGTSIPELAAGITAAINNSSGLVIGSVVGSNISNLCLIIGSAAAVRPITTEHEMLKRDGYMMLFAAGLFSLVILDGSISRTDAAIFLVLYMSYTIFLIEMDPERKKYYFGDFVRYFFQCRYLATIGSRLLSVSNRSGSHAVEKRIPDGRSKAGIAGELVRTVASGAAVIIGARYLVREALFFADFWGVSESLIGITIIAVGTSLPELSVSITAARMGYGSMAVGNVLGSNIVNILLVLGISGMISPLSVARASLLQPTFFMVAITVVFLIFIRSHWEIKRVEGLVLLVVYAAFIAFLLR